MALKPDVLILAEWQYQTIGSELPKLEQAGIPIIVVDFNAQSVERHTQSAKILGNLQVPKNEQNKIADEYAQGITDIQNV